MQAQENELEGERGRMISAIPGAELFFLWGGGRVRCLFIAHEGDISTMVVATERERLRDDPNDGGQRDRQQPPTSLLDAACRETRQMVASLTTDAAKGCSAVPNRKGSRRRRRKQRGRRPD